MSLHKPAAVRRYHPALVTLHWLLAALLLFSLGVGSFVLADLPNSAPGKISTLQGHMVAGGLILLLMLLRIGVRLKTAHPPAASTGHALLDRLAPLTPLTHGGLYLLVLLMAGSGVAMSVMAGLPAIVAKLLMLAIAAHIAAALYHQFVRRDGLFARMGFGPR